MFIAGRTFEGELSIQQSLADHLLARAADAFDGGDTDSFRYATEIYEETKSRARDVEMAKNTFDSALKERAEGGSPERAYRALVVGAMVLNGPIQRS